MAADAAGQAGRGSFVDRAVDVLVGAGRPMTTNELIGCAGPAGTVRSAAQRLARDDRLVRTGRNHWSLAEWGAAPYRPLEAGLAAAGRPRRRRHSPHAGLGRLPSPRGPSPGTGT
jgi:hypothetical protein